jgi:hypothetical protein
VLDAVGGWEGDDDGNQEDWGLCAEQSSPCSFKIARHFKLKGTEVINSRRRHGRLSYLPGRPPVEGL